SDDPVPLAVARKSIRKIRFSLNRRRSPLQGTGVFRTERVPERARQVRRQGQRVDGTEEEGVDDQRITGVHDEESSGTTRMFLDDAGVLHTAEDTGAGGQHVPPCGGLLNREYSLAGHRDSGPERWVGPLGFERTQTQHGPGLEGRSAGPRGWSRSAATGPGTAATPPAPVASVRVRKHPRQ